MALQSVLGSSSALISAPFKLSAKSHFTSFDPLLPCFHRSPQKKLLQARCASTENASEKNGAFHFNIGKSALGLAAAAVLLTTNMSTPALAEEFSVYYGTAASASSYGGYGGNASKKDTAEYTYEIPAAWKERAISKVEKGTNGTDSEFFNPKKRTEKVYTTFLAGFRKLPPKENVLTNLALSDVNLQDLIASAESIDSVETYDDSGQQYYEFEINSAFGHSLISVTCSRNKIYAHFVNAPSADWTRDESLLRYLHSTFKTTPAV